MKNRKDSGHPDLSFLVVVFVLIIAAAHLLVDPSAAKWKRVLSFVGFGTLAALIGLGIWKLLVAIFDAFFVKAF